MTDIDDLLTPADLAARLGVCVKTLENWRADGRGPAHFKIGRRVVYTRQAVNAWLDALAGVTTLSAGEVA